MPDPNENKKTVRAFYDLSFNQKELEEAVACYVGSTYTQHNQAAGGGPGPFIEFVRAYTSQFPELHVDIKRVIADDDLVVTRSLIRTSSDDRGIATAGVFRLAEGKVVEHWGAFQPVPENAANDNTMF